MGKAFETVTAQVTAPGSTLTLATALTGNSMVIRNGNKPAELVTAWGQHQGAGNVRLTSPLMHDNTVGITWRHYGGVNNPPAMALNPSRSRQKLEAQDTLSLSISGSATAGDIEQVSVTLFYSDLPGVDGSFIDSAALTRRMKNLYSSVSSLAVVTTGQYGTAEGIVSDMDSLKANTEYAVLGIGGDTTSYGWTGVRLVGPDWGNLGICVPSLDVVNGALSWFVDMSDATGLPCIPVFNSANKAVTTVAAYGNENMTALSISVLLAELSR